MANKKCSLMRWVIIICWIVVFALIFLKCFGIDLQPCAIKSVCIAAMTVKLIICCCKPGSCQKSLDF